MARKTEDVIAQLVREKNEALSRAEEAEFKLSALEQEYSEWAAAERIKSLQSDLSEAQKRLAELEAVVAIKPGDPQASAMNFLRKSMYLTRKEANARLAAEAKLSSEQTEIERLKAELRSAEEQYAGCTQDAARYLEDSDIAVGRRLEAERELGRALALLKVAACPNCDGSGAIQREVTRTEAGCCGRPHDNGECCGNAIPVPVPDLELEQCQWCGEREALNE